MLEDLLLTVKSDKELLCKVSVDGRTQS